MSWKIGCCRWTNKLSSEQKNRQNLQHCLTRLMSLKEKPLSKKSKCDLEPRAFLEEDSSSSRVAEGIKRDVNKKAIITYPNNLSTLIITTTLITLITHQVTKAARITLNNNYSIPDNTPHKRPVQSHTSAKAAKVLYAPSDAIFLRSASFSSRETDCSCNAMCMFCRKSSKCDRWRVCETIQVSLKIDIKIDFKYPQGDVKKAKNALKYWTE